MGRIIKRRSKLAVLVQAILLAFCLLRSAQNIPSANASIVSNVYDWVNGEDAKEIVKTLSIFEISEMRVRDIKRRLTREHGYGSDEVANMLDKKDLINALSFEEHKTEQKESDRKKRVVFRRTVIMALICVIVVMFRPLFEHAWEVLCVNVEVYTDKKKYEFSRIREFQSMKAAFGLFLMVIMDSLRLWLSISVILSWVMKSKYFFPVPHIPIRPAALVAAATGNAGGAGPLGHYGMNIGPMVVSGLFRFLNGKLEGWMGKALSEANKLLRKKQKKQRKAEQKEEEKRDAAIAKEERRAARRARRKEKEERRKAAEEEAAKNGSGSMDSAEDSGCTNGNNTSSEKSVSDDVQPSIQSTAPVESFPETYGAMDELD